MRIRDELAVVLTRQIPHETILITKSRGEGRRILAECAKKRMLVGVRGETVFSLAAEVCAPLMSGEGGYRLMDRFEAEELVLECLREQTGNGIFAQPESQNLTTASMLYTTFQELAMACVGELTQPGKQQALQCVRAAYCERKKERRVWDRSDVLQKAIEELGEKEVSLQQAVYVMPDNWRPTRLESRFIAALAGDGATTVAVDTLELDDLARYVEERSARTSEEQEEEGEKLLANQWEECRFFRCRGMATEVRHVFRDILKQERSLEDCAVVYLSGEYGQMLLETAGRFGLPVTVSGGVSMKSSLLYYGLRTLAELPARDFNAESVCRLLEQWAYAGVAESHALVKRIRTYSIGWGDLTRYLLVTKYDPDDKKRPDDRVLEEWERFLTAMFHVAQPEESATLEEQKQELLDFLQNYAYHAQASEAAARSEAMELVNSVTSLSQGETLLSRLLRLVEGSSYCSGNAVPGALFCAPVSQGFCTGRRHLYVIGMSRYSVHGGSESPILLDDERVALGMDTVETREAEARLRFWQLVSQHVGTVTFSYPDFDSSRIMELLPSREFELLCGGMGLDEAEPVSYIAGDSLTMGDYVAGAMGLKLKAAPKQAPDDCEAVQLEPAKSLKEQMSDYIHSTTSLESALKCPLQFYLQRVLNLYLDTPPRRNERRWLEKNTMGSLCHEVLEKFYAGDGSASTDIETPEGKARLEEIFRQSFEKFEAENPPTWSDLMEADKENALRMIENAIRWTKDHGRGVVAAEQKFGAPDDTVAPGGLRLKVGQRELLLRGSIDRVDRVGEDQYAILDYKTGDIKKMERDRALHLQDYLYALAEKELSGGTCTPSEAGYLMLESDEVVYIQGGDAAENGETEKRICALLDLLEDEEKILEAAPGFSLSSDGKSLVLAEPEEREKIYAGCKYYCSHKDFCPWYQKEVSLDGDE